MDQGDGLTLDQLRLNVDVARLGAATHQPDQ
jgi:hypothetical protein